MGARRGMQQVGESSVQRGLPDRLRLKFGRIEGRQRPIRGMSARAAYTRRAAVAVIGREDELREGSQLARAHRPHRGQPG